MFDFQPRPMSVQLRTELHHQWRCFAQHGGAQLNARTGEWRLHNMVSEDANRLDFQRFLAEERRTDHTRRMANNDTLSLMGSLTHIDLARVWTNLKKKTGLTKDAIRLPRTASRGDGVGPPPCGRGTVCCTSTAGRGLWYIYQENNHRWFFDRDGPNVLLACHRVLLSYLEDLRAEVARAARVAVVPTANSGSDNGSGTRGGGRRTGSSSSSGPTPTFTVLVNFPNEVDDITVQRAALVHLDTVIGDIRQVQSIMRALAVFLYDGDFVSHLDVKHEHLGGAFEKQIRRSGVRCRLPTACWIWIDSASDPDDRMTWSCEGRPTPGWTTRRTTPRSAAWSAPRRVVGPPNTNSHRNPCSRRCFRPVPS